MLEIKLINTKINNNAYLVSKPGSYSPKEEYKINLSKIFVFHIEICLKIMKKLGYIHKIKIMERCIRN